MSPWIHVHLMKHLENIRLRLCWIVKTVWNICLFILIPTRVLDLHVHQSAASLSVGLDKHNFKNNRYLKA